MEAHRWESVGAGSERCRMCGWGPGHEVHLYALPGMSAEEQLEARARQQAQELTDRMREPGRDISARAGEMERHAPLFFGTGENPILFGGYK